MNNTFDRFCLVLSQLPKGYVCSYGHLAKLAGLGGPRQSSQLLKHLPSDSTLPWYRVVNAQGKLADFVGADKQRLLLEAEGITFTSAGYIPRHYFL
ncbi:hypothetical protein AB835_12475 [Candidatus Endobugula sertula]|uniref:Methylated-DNA-[protein]-cysteine S-methyltransferase DNA binding domain-containing protein n=1 Tax=Candidatus Endobugula sertula TaxID=62101 RepID=A0A1D2QMD7_9GAMM|nr:hypothetical protein AB835_12475 [Candidatus Endobugula sertula]